jgi:hypothetical protein
MIEKFTVHVEEAALDDLKERLARTRWPDQMDGVGWDYGTELGAVRELCEYWRDKFDWRRIESELNRYEHGTTQIDGQRLHFLHARSKHANALPLVITHGWPGSILEFTKILGRSPTRPRTAEGQRTRSTSFARRSRATASRARRTTAAGTCSAWPKRRSS